MKKSLKLWEPYSFDNSKYINELENRKGKIIRYTGSDTTGKCSYTFNELGFRADSIYKNGFKIMSIGCSVTEGVGVNDNETWPYIFSSFIENSVNLNFAFGGRSNDFISRCLITYFDIIKPDLVLIMYTNDHRRDYFTEDGTVEPYHVSRWGYFSEDKKGKECYESFLTLSNDEENFQNWYKNHLLIKYFLETKKCNWLWNGWFLNNNNYSDGLRFDGDFSSLDFGVDNIHPGYNSYLRYSINLFKYIKEKFPTYIPDTNIDINSIKKYNKLL